MCASTTGHSWASSTFSDADQMAWWKARWASCRLTGSGSKIWASNTAQAVVSAAIRRPVGSARIAWMAIRSSATRVAARSRSAAASSSATRRPRYGSKVSRPSRPSCPSASRTVARLTWSEAASATSVSFSPGRSAPSTMPRRISVITASRRVIDETGSNWA